MAKQINCSSKSITKPSIIINTYDSLHMGCSSLWQAAALIFLKSWTFLPVCVRNQVFRVTQRTETSAWCVSSRLSRALTTNERTGREEGEGRCWSVCQELWGFDLPTLQASINWLSDLKGVWTVVAANGIIFCLYGGEERKYEDVSLGEREQLHPAEVCPDVTDQDHSGGDRIRCRSIYRTISPLINNCYNVHMLLSIHQLLEPKDNSALHHLVTLQQSLKPSASLWQR